MPDPITASVIKKLLSLQTPIAVRIFEIALLLGLIAASQYVADHFKSSHGSFLELAAESVGIVGFLALFFLMFSLIAIIAKEFPTQKK